MSTARVLQLVGGVLVLVCIPVYLLTTDTAWGWLAPTCLIMVGLVLILVAAGMNRHARRARRAA